MIENSIHRDPPPAQNSVIIVEPDEAQFHERRWTVALL
jgi:hypothetical protein